MEERHENEQYFFDAPTVARLCDFIGTYSHPCLLCAPSVGTELHARGKKVAVLDIDDRFRHLAGFVEWSIFRPRYLEQRFDLIVCDPPFFNVSLSQLFDAIRLLSHFDTNQRVMISYLTRRSNAILGTFAPFGMRATGYHPGYQTVRSCEKNEIEFFANFDLQIASGE